MQWALVIALPACTGGMLTPVPRQSVQRSVFAAVEATLSGDPIYATVAIESARTVAADADHRSSGPTGLPSALALLAASVATARDARVVRLEAVAESPPDPIARKIAWNLLEWDDRWLAEELERDAIYSRFAGFWNGVLQMGYAALQGNPFGVARPIVAGVEGVVQRDAVDPRERKKLALYRRWIRRGGGADLNDGALRDLQDDVESLRLAILEEELLLADKLLALERTEAVLAHVEIARLLGAEPAAVDAVLDAAQAGVRARSDALAHAFVPPSRTGEAEGRSAASIWIGGAPGLIASGRDREAQAVARARDELRSDQWRYVLSGRRSSKDPLLRRREVRRDMHRSIADVLSVVLWPPIALVRGVHTLIGDPVDDQPLVDALSAAALAEADAARRAPLLVELCDRYEARDELRKALGIARALDGEEARAAALEERIQERIAPSPSVIGTDSIPFVALGDLEEALGLATLESPPSRVEVTERGVQYLVADGPAVEIDVSAPVHVRLRALAEEWRWRRRALERAGYSEATDGVPVSLEAGVGASGVSLIPKFLPEAYVARDRRYFE